MENHTLMAFVFTLALGQYVLPVTSQTNEGDTNISTERAKDEGTYPTTISTNGAERKYSTITTHTSGEERILQVKVTESSGVSTTNGIDGNTAETTTRTQDGTKEKDGTAQQDDLPPTTSDEPEGSTEVSAQETDNVTEKSSMENADGQPSSPDLTATKQPETTETITAMISSESETETTKPVPVSSEPKKEMSTTLKEAPTAETKMSTTLKESSKAETRKYTPVKTTPRVTPSIKSTARKHVTTKAAQSTTKRTSTTVEQTTNVYTTGYNDSHTPVGMGGPGKTKKPTQKGQVAVTVVVWLLLAILVVGLIVGAWLYHRYTKRRQLMVNGETPVETEIPKNMPPNNTATPDKTDCGMSEEANVSLDEVTVDGALTGVAVVKDNHQTSEAKNDVKAKQEDSDKEDFMEMTEIVSSKASAEKADEAVDDKDKKDEKTEEQAEDDKDKKDEETEEQAEDDKDKNKTTTEDNLDENADKVSREDTKSSSDEEDAGNKDVDADAVPTDAKSKQNEEEEPNEKQESESKADKEAEIPEQDKTEDKKDLEEGTKDDPKPEEEQKEEADQQPDKDTDADKKDQVFVSRLEFTPSSPTTSTAPQDLTEDSAV